MKLLILGGGVFLGPHIVREALARGHDVTVFNRGKTGGDPPNGVTRLRGDRYSDLSELETGSWDSVIDTFAYLPHVVRASTDVLRSRVGHFNMISTISVYADFSEPGMDESAELASISDEDAAAVTDHKNVGRHYGALKARCEQVYDSRTGGRSGALRAGLIVGDGDPTNRFTWWVHRGRRGGRIVAPGHPDRPMQFINVRDVAAFAVAASEQQLTGPMNVDSTPGSHTAGRLLDACLSCGGSGGEPVWIDESFLDERGIVPWQQLPGWMPSSGPFAGFGHMRVSRAIEHGLRQTPLKDTVAQTLAWIDRMPGDLRAALERARDPVRDMHAGLSDEAERALLDAWDARSTAG